MNMLRALLISTVLTRAWAAPLPLMPEPARVAVTGGRLSIGAGFRAGIEGYSDARLQAAVARFLTRIERQTGVPQLPGKGVTLRVNCQGRGSEDPVLGEDESYRLEVTPAAALLKANTVTGALRGLETFAQLIVPGPDGFQVPAVQIEDYPRFPWRGLMLDAARHWMPVPVVERNLDAMAAVKLNVFHWHLSDDQGFRVESKRYPKLQQNGSDGHFYTQAEVREVVGYARDRGIRVVPEFDMPGHTTAWFGGYPELASASGPYSIERRWGIFEPVMDPTREETYAFLDGLLGEMAALFPDRYFHIGGDEVKDLQWKNSQPIQAFARAQGLAESRDLEAYFTRRVQKLLKKHDKTMIGWDEVMEPGLEADAVIQSWRGQASLADAARKGYRSLLSFGYYLDHLKPASAQYAVDPRDGDTGSLTPEQAARILGGEACMWSEYVSAETVDSRIWPRLAAIAERFWSPREVRDPDSMYERMEAVSRSLAWTGIRHRSSAAPMLDRLAGGRSARPLEVLAEASEALGIEGRRGARRYSSLVPLNRFVDAVQPESELARRLERAVDRVASDPAAAAELRGTLAEWAENEIMVRSLADGNALLAELIPLARNLSAMARMGLGALDALEKRQPAAPGWVEQQSKELEKLDQPVAEVRLAAVRPVRRLLASVARRAAEIRLQPLETARVRCGNEPRCNGTTTVVNWTYGSVQGNITLENNALGGQSGLH
jgi:hexosaminidase